MRDDASLTARVEALDWTDIARNLDAHGYATTPPLLDPAACDTLVDLYGQDRFRSRVIMARHGFGKGEYQYFAEPLPPTVATLRRAFYPHLAPTARAWSAPLGLDTPFPDDLESFRRLCRAAGQSKPTPLLLRYGAGDYNCLHQDLYGAVVFPLQLTVLLSRRRDFDGGEFVLVEQRPRMQSRAEVVPLDQGQAVIFAVRHRPVAGPRGTYRVNLRHGVSRVTRGQRYTLGIIFRDAA